MTAAVQTPDPDELLPAGPAARLAGCSPQTLRRAVVRGWLTATQTPGGHARYRRRDVLEAIRHRKLGGPT